MSRPWCKNYRGMRRNDACEAGVRFDSLPNHGTRDFMGSCPCFGPRSGCDLAAYPTAEELAEEDARINKRFEQINKARLAIVEQLGGPWKLGTPGASGMIDCPICSGHDTLRFSRSGYNGHIHAECITEGCVRWME